MSEPALHIPASCVDMRLREKAHIEKALQATDWKTYGTGGAAELLGLNPTTLLSRIKKMEIGSPFRNNEGIINRNTIIIFKRGVTVFFFEGTLKRQGCSIQSRALLLHVIQCNMEESHGCTHA